MVLWLEARPSLAGMPTPMGILTPSLAIGARFAPYNKVIKSYFLFDLSAKEK